MKKSDIIIGGEVAVTGGVGQTTMAETFAYCCNDCEHLFDEPGDPLYECSRCSQQSTERRCDQCNIFMARVEGPGSCPACESGEIEEGEFSPPPPPTPEELAQRAEAQARHDREMAARLRQLDLDRKARNKRWLEPGGLAEGFCGITDKNGRDLGEVIAEDVPREYVARTLASSEAIQIACRLVGCELPEPVVHRDNEEYPAYHARLSIQAKELWGNHFEAGPLAAAFDFLPDWIAPCYGEGASGVGFSEAQMEQLALRLQEVDRA